MDDLNQSNSVAVQDEPLATPIPGVSWNVSEPDVLETIPPSVYGEPVSNESTSGPEPDKRSEVAKILVVVAVGVFGGIMGGVTLAKYGIHNSQPVPSKTTLVAKAALPAAKLPSATPVTTAPAEVQPAPQSNVSEPAPTSASPSKAALLPVAAVKPVSAPTVSAPAEVLGIYAQQKNAATEVMVFLSGPTNVKPEKLANPNRLFFDLPGAAVNATALDPVAHLSNPLVQRVRTGRSADGTRVVLDMKSGFNFKYAVSSEAPYRMTITLQPE